MLFALKTHVRRLYPLCHLYTTAASTITASSTWGETEKKALIDLVNRSYRGKIKGDWDAVVRNIEQTPTKHYRRWTFDEVRTMAEMVQTEFGNRRLGAEWQEIGRRFGRSPSSCISNYYRYLHEQKDAISNNQFCGDQELVEQVSSVIDKHSQDADSKGVVAVDWHAVALETGNPILDILESLNRMLQVHKTKNDATQSHYQIPCVPIIVIQQLLYPQAWLPSHIQRLQRLVNENQDQMIRLNIQIVSLFMGIDQRSCALALDELLEKKNTGIAAKGKRWAKDETERLRMAIKENGVDQTWDLISARVGTRSAQACYSYWHRARNEAAIKAKNNKNIWTAEQLARVTEMIWNKRRSSRILPLVCKLFPDMSQVEARLLVKKCSARVTSLRLSKQLTQDQDTLVKCVDEVRDAEGNIDWRAVGSRMQAPPALCRVRYGEFVCKKMAH
ncbi:hypothetical protein FB639_001426, partial [Coemansia asiatica]